MGDKADDQDKQVGEIYNLACMFVVQVLFSKDPALQILFSFLFSTFTLPTIITPSVHARRSILFWIQRTLIRVYVSVMIIGGIMEDQEADQEFNNGERKWYKYDLSRHTPQRSSISYQ